MTLRQCGITIRILKFKEYQMKAVHSIACVGVLLAGLAGVARADGHTSGRSRLQAEIA
jgi:hypothetical protein